MGQRFPVARFYRTAAGRDLGLFPHWQKAGASGDRLVYPFVVQTCGREDARTITIAMVRSLASCWQVDEKYLLQSGTWLIANALDQQELGQTPSEFVLHTGNVDLRAGSEAYLNQLVREPQGRQVGAAAIRYDIFLSYASPDAISVQEVAATLTRLGVKVWLDRDQISYGAVMQDVIDQGIGGARFFGFIITPASLAERPWVRYEQSNAWQRELSENRIVVIPILLAGELGSLPDKYRKKKCVDLRGDRQAALEDLARFLIGQRQGHEPSATALASPPARTVFPMLSVDSELIDYDRPQGRVHRYELHVRVDNPALRPIDGCSIDIWFPALACSGNQGFHSGRGSRGPTGTSREQVGVRWSTSEKILPGQEVVVCPTRDRKHPYRVDDRIDDALGSDAEVGLEMFAATGHPLHGRIPWHRLHMY